MSDPGRNAAGVSTFNVKTPRPVEEDSISDDPPPYSACVLYPPTIYSNYPETHSSLPDNPPVYPGEETPNPGIQTGNYLYEGGPSAPFLDGPSTSENPSGVNNPRVTRYNDQPECKPSWHGSQENPPIYRHQQKTILIRRSSGTSPRNKFVGLCTTMLVAIVILTVVIAGMRSQFNKNQKIHHRNVPDIYEETKIKPLYKDDSHETFDFGDGTKINMLDFEALGRAVKERVDTILNCLRIGKKNETYSNNVKVAKSREAKVTKPDHVTDCILKKSGKEEDGDSSQSNFEQKYPNFSNVVNKDILGIPRKEKTNEDVVRKSAYKNIVV